MSLRNRRNSKIRHKRRQRRSRRQQTEPLEVRRLLAAIVWDGEAGDGNWHSAENWFDETNGVNDVLPAAADDVAIRAGFASTTVAIQDADVSVNSLQSAAGLELTSSRTLTLADTSRIDGHVELAGTINGTGTLTVAASMNWTGGAMNESGTTVIGSDAVLSVDASGVTMDENRTLENRGTINWVRGGLGARTGAGIHNTAGALFDLQANVQLGSTAPGPFVNDGTFRKSVGTGTALMVFPFENSGVVEVQSGTLRLYDGVSTGDILLSDGTTLQQAFLHTYTFDVPAGKRIGRASAADQNVTYHIEGVATVQGTGDFDFDAIELSGGRLDLARDLTVPHVELDGTIAGQTTLTVTDSLDWSRGSFSDNLTAIIADGAVLTVDGGGVSLSTGATLENRGTVNWLRGGLGATTAEQVHNTAEALFDIQANVSFSSAFVNEGVLRKSAGGGQTTLLELQNAGTIEIQTGTLRVKDGSSTGDILLSDGTTLHQLSLGQFTFDVPAGRRLGRANGADQNVTLLVEGSPTVQGAGDFDFDMIDIDFNSAHLTLARDVIVPRVELDGTIAGSGTLTVTESMDWLRGSMDDNGTAVIEDDAVLSLNSAHNKSLNQGRTLENRGIVNWLQGALSVSTGSRIHNTASGVFDVQVGAILSTNGGEKFLNDGVFRKSTSNADVEIRIPFENNGTVDVRNGTLEFRGSPANFDDSGAETHLDGGTWRISTADPIVDFAGIVIDDIGPIDVLNADVTLDGTGVTFDNDSAVPLLTGLDRIDPGSRLTLTHDYDLALQPGDLENQGSLTIGPSSTLAVDGQYTQSADARLTIGLGGDPATGLFGHVASTSDARLDGTFEIDLVDGFGPTTGQSYEVMTFANRVGGFSVVEGLFLGATQAFEVIENADNVIINALADANDLAIDPLDIAITGSGVVGEQISVTYTVDNLTDRPAVGDWVDSLYLSADTFLDPFDVLLGRVTHTGGVAGLDSYTETLVAPLSGVLPGNYRVIVVADSRGLVPDRNRTDNNATSPEVIQAQFTEIAIGGSVSGVVAAGEELFYQLDVPPAADVLLSGDFDAPGGVEISVRFGQVPDLAAFDQFVSTADTAQPSLLLSDLAGTYYVRVRGRDDLSGGPRSFQLAAEALGLTAVGVSPGSGSNAGAATVTITGSGFTQTTTVRLDDGAGTERPASRVTFSSSNTLFATFDLTGLSPGGFDIVVEDAGESAVLPDAWTVTAGETGRLETRISVLKHAPFRRATPFVVDYANTGETDIRAPLIEVRVNTDDVFLRADSESPFRSGVVQFLGINRDGPAGVLPAGASHRREFEVFPDGSAFGETVTFSVRVIDDPDAVIDWALFKEDLRPAAFAEDAWDAIFERYVSFMDTDGNGESTLGEYEQVLADAATYLSELGEYTDSVPRLVNFLIGLANNQYPHLTLTRAVDAQAPAAGMPLTWQRAFLQPISRRFQLGPFGRGWTSSWDWRAETDADGAVSIGTLSGTREFRLAPDGSFNGTGGEPATLTREGADYVLRESNGDVLRFDAASGRLVQVADRNGNSITLQYAGGQLTELQHSNGDWFALEYSGGRIVRMTDQAGRETTYMYDATNEYLLSVTGPRGTTEYTYETSGGLAAHALLSITRPDQTATLFEYDEFGRLVARMESGGQARSTLEYGDLTEPGRIRLTDVTTGGVTTYHLNDRNRIESVTNPSGNTRQFAWDEFSRMTDAALPGNFHYGTHYDDEALSASMVDPRGQSVDVQFDPLFGETILHSDEVGQQSAYELDMSGNRITVTYPDGSRETRTYDSEGNVTSYTNRRGQQIQLVYNGRGQVLRENHADGSFREFTYDDRGNMTSASNAQGTITLTYDSGDRVVRIEYPDGRFLAWDRDAAGRVTRKTDSDGFEINYGFDAAGRLIQLTDAEGTPLVTYTYDNAGRQVREDHGNGTFSTFEYNANDQVTRIAHHAPNGTVNSSFDYEYDELGRRTSSTSDAGTTRYGYDALGQLTSVTRPSGRVMQYQYDAVGRRLAIVDDGVVTNYVSNELQQYTLVGTAIHAYDADGNLIRVEDGGKTTRYAWDDQNRLVRVDDGSSIWTWEYDALGQRVASTRDGVRTEYLIDPFGLGNVAAEYDATGNLLRRYVHTDNGPVAQVLPSESPSYYDIDASGSVVALTDASGTPINQYEYLPFGEIVQANETVANPYTFVGGLGVSTDDTGLSFMRNRYYGADTGAFLSVDPLLVASVEPYGYAANNPVQFVDPRGLSPFGGFADAIKKNKKLKENAGAGPEGTSQDEMDALSCSGKQVQEGASEFNKELADKLGLPPSSIEDALKVVWWLITLGMEVDSDGGDGGGGGPGGGPGGGGGGSGSGGPGGGGGGGGGTCCGGGCGGDGGAAGPAGDGDGGSGSSEVLGSFDPNDIIGPAGVGIENHIPPGTTLPYTIQFENLDEATAPANVVRITQQLDTDLDLSTFELGDFGFGDLHIDVPAGRNAYRTRIDLTDTVGSLVDVSAGVNLNTGLATWTFTSLDPATLDLPSDPFLGFLPPNQTSPEGEGFVAYTIRSQSGLTTGTRIDALATIIFDNNDPIDTPAIFNTIDAGAPTSSVDPLPAEVFSETFTVSWTGADDAGGAGVASYDVFVSEDGGQFTLWRERTAETSATFTGQFGSTYGFSSVATDLVGFREPTPAAAEATTSLVDPQLTADAGGPYTVDEGGALTLSGSGSSPVPGTLTLEWDLDGDGIFETSGADPEFSAATLDGPLSLTVTLRVTDPLGNTKIDIAAVQVDNVAPTAVAGGPYSGDVGDDILLDASGSSDPIDTPLEFAWDLNDDGLFDDAIGATTIFSSAVVGTFPVSVRVSDDDGGLQISRTTVTVTSSGNQPPQVDPITGPDAAVPQQPLTFVTAFTDPDPEPHQATIDWGDGTSEAAVIETTADGGTVTGSHVYAEPGEYTVQFTIRDEFGNVTAAQKQVAVSRLLLTDDPEAPGKKILTVGGTPEDDRIRFRLRQRRTMIEVRMGHALDRFPIDALSRLVAWSGTGRDVLRVQRAIELPAELHGGEGDDHLRGGNGPGRLHGGPGNDRIYGGRGDDVIDGGAGDNWIHAGQGNNTVTAGDGDDRILSRDGDDSVDAGSGSNRIWTGSGDDSVVSGDGGDWIVTCSGDDVVQSGGGNDRILAGSGNDSVDAGAGHDVVWGGPGSDILVGQSGNDWLLGGFGDDLLIGGVGSDRLFGHLGQDLLIAGTTVYDQQPYALELLRSEWTSGRHYVHRVDNIRRGEGPILDGSGVRLETGVTVHDDEHRDWLFGGSGRDWLFADLDRDLLVGRRSGERVN